MHHIAATMIVLACLGLGEAISRWGGVAMPGPVLGMVALLGAMALRPALVEVVRPVLSLLLRVLPLLFVPAGVGVVAQLDRLGDDGVALAVALGLSTVLAILATALTFVGVARLRGQPDE